MFYRVIADALVVIHFAFIIFVIFGGFLSLRWRRLIYLHIPAALWGILIEFSGWICPLTPLENYFRVHGGEAGYQGGYIEHYLLPVIYPADLTRDLQLLLGIIIIGINVTAYGLYIFLRKKTAK